MLVIRFNRVGRHNHAQYRLVVQEKSKAPSGKHIAIVGSYDPHSKQTVLKEEEIKNFLANGAQPSDSVYNLLVRNGVIKGDKRIVKLPEKKEDKKVKDEANEKTVEEKKDDADDKEKRKETKEEKKDIDTKKEKIEKKENSQETKSEDKKEETEEKK